MKFPRNTSHIGRGGFTLVEVVVATAISVAVGLIALGGLVQGVHLFKCNESEMWAREKGSRIIRSLRDDMQKATAIRIYANQSSISGAGINYGSCLVLDLPDSGRTVAYYRNALNANSNSGRIFYDSNTTSAPAPASDKLLLSGVMDMEFRKNPNGSIRVGFQVATLGYPRRLYGSIEADRIRYTTSILPRNL